MWITGRAAQAVAPHPVHTAGPAIGDFEPILESANVVVRRVGTENDMGRDALVDIADGTDVAGRVICVQVEFRKSFLRDGQRVFKVRDGIVE